MTNIQMKHFVYSWRPPRSILRLSEDRHQHVRETYNIVAEGEDIPPPICRFEVCSISSALLYNEF